LEIVPRLGPSDVIMPSTTFWVVDNFSLNILVNDDCVRLLSSFGFSLALDRHEFAKLKRSDTLALAIEYSSLLFMWYLHLASGVI